MKTPKEIGMDLLTRPIEEMAEFQFGLDHAQQMLDCAHHIMSSISQGDRSVIKEHAKNIYHLSHHLVNHFRKAKK